MCSVCVFSTLLCVRLCDVIFLCISLHLLRWTLRSFSLVLRRSFSLWLWGKCLHFNLITTAVCTRSMGVVTVHSVLIWNWSTKKVSAHTWISTYYTHIMVVFKLFFIIDKKKQVTNLNKEKKEGGCVQDYGPTFYSKCNKNVELICSICSRSWFCMWYETINTPIRSSPTHCFMQVFFLLSSALCVCV